MKKIFTILIILALYSCSSTKPKNGFIDDDTYVFFVEARGSKTDSETKNRATCLSAARTMASTVAIESLINKGWDNVKGKIEKSQYKSVIMKSLQGQVSGLSMLDVNYDPKTNKCQAKMQIKKAGLKQTFETALKSVK